MGKSRDRFGIFKTFKLEWWQAGLFKWGVLAFGIAVGSYWPQTFINYEPILLGFAVINLIYIIYIWAKQ